MLDVEDRTEYKVLNSAEIMSATLDRIGCKLNVFNEDGVYRNDRFTEGTTCSHNSPATGGRKS